MRALFIALLPLTLLACKSIEVPVTATPIQAVLAQGKDDQRVVIRGQVVRKLEDERFVVADNTGSIRVKIDDDAVRRAGLGIGSHVEVAGEVDTNTFRDSTIKAERVAVLAAPVAVPAPRY